MKFDEYGNEIIDDDDIIENPEVEELHDDEESTFTQTDEDVYERRTYRRANGPERNDYDRPSARKAKFS